jgi:DNA-binding MarR family transcriptional regulator
VTEAKAAATDDLASELNSIAIHLVRRLRQADSSLGVSPSRLSALSVLVFGGPRSINALADAEQVAGPTMSKLVNGLEADGLVRRRADPTDGRAVVLSATVKGRRLMERGRRQRVARLATELSGLTAGERRTLRDAAAILRRLE